MTSPFGNMQNSNMWKLISLVCTDAKGHHISFWSYFQLQGHFLTAGKPNMSFPCPLHLAAPGPFFYLYRTATQRTLFNFYYLVGTQDYGWINENIAS